MDEFVITSIEERLKKIFQSVQRLHSTTLRDWRALGEDVQTKLEDLDNAISKRLQDICDNVEGAENMAQRIESLLPK